MICRAVAGCAAAVLGVLLSLNVPAASACEGAGCRAGKPLDIMRFMLEQAASTRVGEIEPSHGKVLAKAKVHRRSHGAVAAQPQPTPIPAEAAASFASRPGQQVPENVEFVASDEANAIDRAADAAPVETTGAAAAGGPAVQLVDAAEFNDIDRKADDRLPLSARVAGGDGAPTHSERASLAWLHWLWSALGSTLAALATAVRQLIHI